MTSLNDLQHSNRKYVSITTQTNRGINLNLSPVRKNFGPLKHFWHIIGRRTIRVATLQKFTWCSAMFCGYI